MKWSCFGDGDAVRRARNDALCGGRDVRDGVSCGGADGGRGGVRGEKKVLRFGRKSLILGGG